MEALARDTIIEEAMKVRPGTLTRVGYTSELPVKAEYKKKGYRMFKIVETSVRLGVNYHNIASVIARKAEEGLKEAVQRTNNYEWVIKNKVSHNTATGKDYLYVANFNNGHNTKTRYFIEGTFVGTIDMGDEIDEHFAHLLIPSYWNRKSNGGEVRTISFDNIYKIRSAGASLIR